MNLPKHCIFPISGLYDVRCLSLLSKRLAVLIRHGGSLLESFGNVDSYQANAFERLRAKFTVLLQHTQLFNQTGNSFVHHTVPISSI